MFKLSQFSVFLMPLVFFSSNKTLFAQNNLQDSIPKELPLVKISAEKIKYSLLLNEVEGLGIYAAKKTNVVLTENLDANVALNNPRQVFAKVAGMVAIENDGTGLQNNLAFRGLSSNRSWEFNNRQNGYDISADNFGYPETYYAPPMELVKRIEIVRGAAALQYGPQVGGLLNYVLKAASTDRPFALESRQTWGSYGVFNLFTAINGTIKKFNYYAATNLRKGDGWRDNNGFKTQHFYLNLGYKFNENSNITLEANQSEYTLQTVGGLTDAQFEANPRQSLRKRNWFNVPWTTASLNFNWEPQEKTKINVKAFGLMGARNSIGMNAAITVPDTINTTLGTYNARQIDKFQFKNAGIEGRILQEYNLGDKKHAVAAGIRLFNGTQTRFQKGKGDSGSDFNLNLQQDRFPFEMDFETKNAAVFAENIFRLGKFAITSGLRYEYVNADAQGRINLASDGTPVLASPESRKRHLLLAGIGAEYHLVRHNEVYFNASSSYRPVLFSDLTPSVNTDEIDPNLQDAKAYNFDLGYRGDWKEIIHFDFGMYYLLYQNRVGTLTKLQENSTNRYQYRTNLGDTRAFGTELYAEANLLKLFKIAPKYGNFNLFGALAWNHARYGNFEITSIQSNQIVQGNLKGNRLEYAPDFVHRYGFNYNLKTFSTSLTINQMAATYTDANNTEAATPNGQSGKIAAYTVVDWSSTLTVKKIYTLACGINNLMNKKYAARRAGGYPGPGLLPGEARSVYVTLGVKF
jgi:Fe(3+) dicitrate transport protein